MTTSEPSELLATNLALAFHDDPVAIWMFPDPESRSRLMTGFFQSQIASGSDIVASADGAAVSIWEFRDGQTSQPSPPAELGDLFARVILAHELLEARHPQQPHLYLPFIGVIPAARGRGLGSELLTRRLELADREAHAAYLEASSPRNANLYLRHGFRPVGDPIVLPDGGPAVQPMWRDPA